MQLTRRLRSHSLRLDEITGPAGVNSTNITSIPRTRAGENEEA